MSEPVEHIEFSVDDTAALVARMEVMSRGGRGWLNVQPEVEGDEEPEPVDGGTGGDAGVAGVAPDRHRYGLSDAATNVYRTLFTSRGPGIPMATWTPPARSQRPARIGIEHGTGPKALRRLADAGTVVPEGWRVVQDHPRTGVVIDAPAAAAPVDVLDWLLEAVAALCPLSLTGRWHADVHPG
ncbi:MAG: hypothetical protein HYX34_04140 [Actinobacteria bacterium]|nr:hypothetical protein [Actinomycetota bacterium]